MQDVLTKIIESKRAELAITDFGDIEAAAKSCKREINSLSSALRSKERGGVLAEFKRRSPSKGWINQDASPAQVAEGYLQAGAAGCSILTNEEYFAGSLEHLKQVRAALPTLPILRKEFIIDSRQIFEARVAGADAILLIASCLTVEQCRELSATAKELGLEILLELHSEDELEHINEYVDMVGVNNRNLGSFVTSLDNSLRMAPLIRERVSSGVVLLSESGIKSSADIVSLRQMGYQGFLIGESFMRGDNPGQALSQMISEL